MTDQELSTIEARQKAATPPGRILFESDIIAKDVPKLIAALREAWESDAESLKLYRAARDRADAANIQLSDLKKAVKELLALKECGTYKEAEIRERVKSLLAGISVEETPSSHPNCYYFNVEHDNFYCKLCNMGQGTNRFADIKHNHRPDCKIHGGAERKEIGHDVARG